MLPPTITARALLLAAAASPPRHGAPVRAALEPSAWSEWSLRDVGTFDAAALALAAAGVYVGTGAGAPSSRSQIDGAASAAREASEALDLRAKPSAPARDPFELPSAFERRLRRRGGDPRMSAPGEALADIVIPNISDTDDERLWVPQTESLSFRPLCLCVSQGYYVNLLRFKGGGVLGCHRHSSPVHAHTIKGAWGYKEHDWTASAGTYVFEPPGETHTLMVHEGSEMIALFHVTGALLYCDPGAPQTVTGFDDVFTKLEKARAHYEACGLGADFVQQFIR